MSIFVKMITDEQLVEYIDSQLPDQKMELIRKQLEVDAELKERFQRLRAVDSHLRHLKLENPGHAFTSNVLANLDKSFAPATTPLWRRNLFVAIAVVAVCFGTAIILLANYSLTDVITTPIPEISVREQTIDLNKVNFINQDIFFKGLIYLNGFLGLLLLERAVLRPFFRTRRQQVSF